jgi:hypothetical protein
MAFQSVINTFLGSGKVGDIAKNSPQRCKAVLLSSAGIPNKIGNAFTRVSGADALGNRAETVRVGGAGLFAGILTNSSQYVSYGTLAGGTLAESMVLLDNTVAQLHDMAEIWVNLPATAAAGNIVTFDPATGDLSSMNPTAQFTGAIATTTLTVSGMVAGGFLGVGSVVSGVGVIPNTIITALVTGLGGNGTYTVSQTQTVAAVAMTAPNQPQPAFVGTGSIAGTVLTMSAMASGQLSVGQQIVGANIPANTSIVSFGTGAGGVGTYNINVSLTVASQAITGASHIVIPNCYVDQYDITATGGLAVIKITN